MHSAQQSVRLYRPVIPVVVGDRYQFFDLAAADQGIVPEDLMKDPELVKALPTFFRTLRGQKPTPEEMRQVAENIRRAGR